MPPPPLICHPGTMWAGNRLVPDARALVACLLAALPDRLAHSRQAGSQARQIAAAVPPEDRDLHIAAALLHDIGYAPALVQTGFHPIDGARHLAMSGAPYRLVGLVAHHSEARLLAEPAGVRTQLSAFEREDSPVTDALSYADMTAGPTGAPMTIEDRLRDIEARHRDDDPALLAARLLREPRLLAAADRVRRRLGRAGDEGRSDSNGRDGSGVPMSGAQL